MAMKVSVPTLPKGYSFIEDKLYFRDENGSFKELGPCIWAKSRTKDVDSEQGHGLVMASTVDGIERCIPISASEVYEDVRGVSVNLANMGIFLSPNRRKWFQEYFYHCLQLPDLPLTTVVKRSGFVDGKAFVRGNTVICPQDSGSEYLIQYRGERSGKGMTSRGTLDSYTQNVLSQVTAPPLKFGVLLGLAAPLADLLSFEGGGVHIEGMSGTGKSTILQLGASVFGSGSDPGEGASESSISSWNSSANSFDLTLPLHAGCGQFLDELGASRERDLNNLIYNIAKGQPKERMSSNINLVTLPPCSTFIVSSGELSIQAKIQQSGQTIKAGILARMPSIEVRAEDMQLEGEDSQQTGQRISSIKQACGEYFGVLGPDFVEQLLNVDLPSGIHDLKTLVQGVVDECWQLLSPYAENSIETRCVKRFALILAGGQLAHELGVIPWSQEEIAESVEFMLERWKNSAETSMTDVERAVERLENYLRSNYHRLPDSEDFKFSGIVEGYQHKDAFLLLPQTFKRLCGDCVPTQVAKELKRLNALTFDTGKNQFRAKLPVLSGRQYFYAIKMSFLAQD